MKGSSSSVFVSVSFTVVSLSVCVSFPFVSAFVLALEPLFLKEEELILRGCSAKLSGTDDDSETKIKIKIMNDVTQIC